jgi:hypothetical protein
MQLILLVAASVATGCYSRNVAIDRPPTSAQISAFNRHEDERAVARLSDSTVVNGRQWEMGTAFMRYTDPDGLPRSVPLNAVQRVDFRISRGKAAGMGLWKGALIGIAGGALLGLLASGEGSCSPAPCTPPEIEPEAGAALGAIAFGALSAALGGTIGLIAGGHLSFSIT